jgi:ribosomal protein L18
MKCIKIALQKRCNTTIEVDWFNELMGNVRWVRLVVTASGDGINPQVITATTSSKLFCRATHTARRKQQSQSSTHNTAQHK